MSQDNWGPSPAFDRTYTPPPKPGHAFDFLSVKPPPDQPRPSTIASRIGAIFYWLGVICLVGNLLGLLLMMAGGAPGAIIFSPLAFVPFLIGWALRWILTGRTDFGA
jgi:hypothetical protein